MLSFGLCVVSSFKPGKIVGSSSRRVAKAVFQLFGSNDGRMQTCIEQWMRKGGQLGEFSYARRAGSFFWLKDFVGLPQGFPFFSFMFR